MGQVVTMRYNQFTRHLLHRFPFYTGGGVVVGVATVRTVAIMSGEGDDHLLVIVQEGDRYDFLLLTGDAQRPAIGSLRRG